MDVGRNEPDVVDGGGSGIGLQHSAIQSFDMFVTVRHFNGPGFLNRPATGTVREHWEISGKRTKNSGAVEPTKLHFAKRLWTCLLSEERVQKLWRGQRGLELRKSGIFAKQNAPLEGTTATV